MMKPADKNQYVISIKNFDKKLISKDLRKQVERIRGKACILVLKSAAENNEWSMHRYAAINGYFSDIVEEPK